MKVHYVGLEVECLIPVGPRGGRFHGSHAQAAIRQRLLETGLFKEVRLGTDGSIDEDYKLSEGVDEFGYKRERKINEGSEWRVMFAQLDTEKAIAALCKELVAANATVNNSCGLHVHIDCTTRDPDKVFKKLVRSIPYMTKLVKKNRLRNTYCKINHDEDRQPDRYMAVNKESYQRHKTIEVRLHHGSIDSEEIITWVKFLINVVISPMPEKPVQPEEAFKAYRVSKSLQALLDKKAKAVA